MASILPSYINLGWLTGIESFVLHNITIIIVVGILLAIFFKLLAGGSLEKLARIKV